MHTLNPNSDFNSLSTQSKASTETPKKSADLDKARLQLTNSWC